MTYNPQLNTELLEAAVDFAVEHNTYDEPEKSNSTAIIWDQANWRTVKDCGTFMCLAGITCQLTGGQWLSNELYVLDNRYLKLEQEERIAAFDYVSASMRATRKLGLTEKEADYLFDGSYKDPDELKLRAKRVINGELRDDEQ
jgi:hypothetical protein